VWSSSEPGKGLYTPGGYAGLINYYIQKVTRGRVKAVMALAAGHASMAAPLQALTEILLGILLILGLLRAPLPHRFCVPRQPLGIGVGTRGSGNYSFHDGVTCLAVGRAGRTWGTDAILARTRPSSNCGNLSLSEVGCGSLSLFHTQRGGGNRPRPG